MTRRIRKLPFYVENPQKPHPYCCCAKMTNMTHFGPKMRTACRLKRQFAKWSLFYARSRPPPPPKRIYIRRSGCGSINSSEAKTNKETCTSKLDSSMEFRQMFLDFVYFALEPAKITKVKFCFLGCHSAEKRMTLGLAGP